MDSIFLTLPVLKRNGIWKAAEHFHGDRKQVMKRRSQAADAYLFASENGELTLMT
jgi:hypothetical protein